MILPNPIDSKILLRQPLFSKPELPQQHTGSLIAWHIVRHNSVQFKIVKGMGYRRSADSSHDSRSLTELRDTVAHETGSEGTINNIGQRAMRNYPIVFNANEMRGSSLALLLFIFGQPGSE